MDPAAPISCTNCHQTTDSTGKTVWICEHCGSENPITSPSVIAEPDAVPDASAAQAAINAALPQATIPPLSTP